MLGTVYKSTGSWYKVKLENGEFVDCKLFGKFRTKNLKSTNPVCVGDNVVVKITDKQTPQIEQINDRVNYLIRKSVKLSKQYHIIASNIDLCFLIITIKNPETSTMFIDRFLASTFSYNIETVLLLENLQRKRNKIFGLLFSRLVFSIRFLVKIFIFISISFY